jgi:hypothetical protein
MRFVRPDRRLAMITAHTDVVGSLLRPVALREAREDWLAGRLTHAQFKSIEDRAVDEAVALQELAGLDVVTDFRDAQVAYWLEGKARPSHVPRCNLLDNVIRPALANRF